MAQTPALSQSIAESMPEGFSTKHADLLNALPQPLGAIRHIVLPEGRDPARTVIHIQDVHENTEAQKNIGQTVQALIEKKVVGLIALEGAFLPIDLSQYRAFPDQGTIRKVADWLLRENKISGPVHAAFISAQQIPPFVGIDDPAHYNANVAAYTTSAPEVQVYKAKLAALKADAEQRKAGAFNPDLLAFDQKIQSYRAGKISLGEYVKTLAAQATTVSPAVRDFVKALDMESALDFKEVESQRARLIDRLIKELSQDDINALVQQSVAYRMGQLRYGDFYRSLQRLCEKHSVPLAQFLAMDAYVKYVLLSDRIAAEKLFDEMNALEKSCYARLAKTGEEKALVAESSRLNLTDKLTDFALTPNEWTEYEALRSVNVPGVPDMASFEAFYLEAAARDQAMTDNLLTAMNLHKTKTAVLVTGGFHSPGVAARLRRAGLAVISFTPKIEKIETANGSAYLSVFTQEKTPLEKLFRGEKLFLSKLQAPKELTGVTNTAVALAEELKDPATPSDTKAVLDQLPPSGVNLRLVTQDAGQGKALGREQGDVPGTVVLEATDGPEGLRINPSVDASWPGRVVAVVRNLLTGKARAANDNSLSKAATTPETMLKGPQAFQDAHKERGAGKTEEEFAKDEVLRTLLDSGVKPAEAEALVNSLKFYEPMDSQRGLDEAGKYRADNLLGAWISIVFARVAERELFTNEKKIDEEIARMHWTDKLDDQAKEGVRLGVERIRKAVAWGRALDGLPAIFAAMRSHFWLLMPFNRMEKAAARAVHKGNPALTFAELMQDAFHQAHNVRAWMNRSPRKALTLSTTFTVPGTRQVGDGYTLSLPDLPPQESKYNLVSEERTRAIDSFHESMGIIDSASPELQGAYSEVKEITDLLLAAAGLDPRNFILHFFDTEDPGASVLRRSNHIFVNVGLIKYLIDKGGGRDALAFVIAHEITHILQGREDMDAGKGASPEDITDAAETMIENYTDEYDADWRALKLLERVHAMTGGRSGFAISEASFFFRGLNEDIQKWESAPGRSLWEKLQTRFGTHPQMKERIRKLESLMNNLYWRSYFRKPTPLSSNTIQEIQSGSRRFRLKQAARNVRTLGEYQGLLAQVTTLEEFEFLLVSTYQRTRSGDARFPFSKAFDLADAKADDLIAQSPHLLPYYLFIMTSIGRYTGELRIDAHKQKEAIRGRLAGLGVKELNALVKLDLPAILESEEDTEYSQYKFFFYGYHRDPRGEPVGFGNYFSVWLDALTEELTDRFASQDYAVDDAESVYEAVTKTRDRIEHFQKPDGVISKSIEVGGRNLSGSTDSLKKLINLTTWWLWKKIESDPAKYRDSLPLLIERLKQDEFQPDLKEIFEGLRRLSTEGQIDPRLFLDLLRHFNKSDLLISLTPVPGGPHDKSDITTTLNIFERAMAKEDELTTYRRNELAAYPSGDLLSFTGDAWSHLSTFMELFRDPTEYYGADMTRVLQRIMDQHRMTLPKRFSFLARALQRFDQELSAAHGPHMIGSLQFDTPLDVFVREVILSAPESRDLRSFLHRNLAAWEKSKDIKGPSRASFPAQKLMYLYSIGSGENPWALRHVLLGRDADNASQVQGAYKFQSRTSDDRVAIEKHPLFGVKLSSQDLLALYRAMAAVPEPDGPRSYPIASQSKGEDINAVTTWDEYIAAVGIETFLQGEGIATADKGLRPQVFDAGEYGDTPSPFKGFTSELFEVPFGQEISSDQFDERGPARQSERYRTYHDAPRRPHALLRQHFNDVPIGTMFQEAFAFIPNLAGTFEEKADYLIKHLPPTVYRNFALYALYLHDVIQPALQAVSAGPLDMDRALDAEYVQAVIREHVSETRQIDLLHAASIVVPHLIQDKKLEEANITAMTSVAWDILGGEIQRTTDPRLAKRSQRKREQRKGRSSPGTTYAYIPAHFDSTAFPAYYFHVPGGVEASISHVLAHLCVPALNAQLRGGTLSIGDKTSTLRSLYPEASPVRDEHLDRFLETASLSPDEMRDLSALFENEALKQKYALRALEKEREARPELFDRPESELDRILHYFPEHGYTRDDLITHLINTRVGHPKLLKRAQSHLLQFQDNVRQEDVRKRVYGHDMIKTVFEHYAFDQEKRKDFLLWALGFRNEKPDFLTILEDYYRINFDSLRAANIEDTRFYANIGKSAFEETLSFFLFGDKGILSHPDSQQAFLDDIFDSILPPGVNRSRVALFRNIYHSVFAHASEGRKEKILKNLFVAFKKLEQSSVASPEQKEALAVRAFLESLGFMGIKLGQFLESADLDLPPHIAAELSRLKENAPPMDKAAAFGAIEVAFGDFDEVFESLDDPVGSASIKMVYKATLKNGRRVVAKIKRPDVEKLVDEEVGLLSVVLDAVRGDLEARGIHLPEDTVERIREMVLQELDFEREMENQKTLRENRARRTDLPEPGGAFAFFTQWLKPKEMTVYIPNSTEIRGGIVMIEELVEGKALSRDADLQAMGIRPDIAKGEAAEELLEQVFIDGEYHADYHGGNILVGADKRLNLIDLGLMGKLSEENRLRILLLLLYPHRQALAEFPGLSHFAPVLGDDRIAAALAQLNIGRPIRIDPAAVARAVAQAGTPAQKLLTLFQLVQKAGGVLPDEIVTLKKGLGTAAYLFSHLSQDGLIRVAIKIIVHGPLKNKQVSEIMDIVQRPPPAVPDSTTKSSAPRSVRPQSLTRPGQQPEAPALDFPRILESIKALPIDARSPLIKLLLFANKDSLSKAPFLPIDVIPSDADIQHALKELGESEDLKISDFQIQTAAMQATDWFGRLAALTEIVRDGGGTFSPQITTLLNEIERAGPLLPQVTLRDIGELARLTLSSRQKKSSPGEGGGSVISAALSPRYFANAVNFETRGLLGGLGIGGFAGVPGAAVALPWAGPFLWLAHAGEPAIRAWRAAKGAPFISRLGAASGAALRRLFQPEVLFVGLGTLLIGLLPIVDVKQALVFAAVVEIFARLHKAVNNTAIEAHILAVMVKAGQAPKANAEEAQALLMSLLSHDRGLSRRLASFGSAEADPQTVVASLKARLHSRNPLMKLLARRLLLRELSSVGASVTPHLLGQFFAAFDAGSGSHLAQTFGGQGLTIFVPPQTTDEELGATALLARAFNADRLAFVAEAGDDRGRVERTVKDILADAVKFDIVPVPKGSFQGNGRQKGTSATLQLSRDTWEALTKRIPPLQRSPLAFGSIKLAGVPIGNPLFQYRESIADLFVLLPQASLRVGTILNLQAIMAVLIAA